MRSLILFLLLALCVRAQAVTVFAPPAAPLVETTSSFTLPSANTSENVVFTYTAPQSLIMVGFWLDLTAIATTTTSTIRIYSAANGGSFVKTIVPGLNLLTGNILWTLATDAKGINAPMMIPLQAGGQFKVTIQNALGEASNRAIPYSYFTRN